MRILVTGAAGFFGQALFGELLLRNIMRGVQIIGATRAMADLVDPIATHALIKHYQPDTVYHLAAHCGGISANQKNPVEFFRDNMLMGMNVLAAAHAHGTRKVVLASTVCAYPEVTEVPFKEASLWSGFPEPTNAPYGIAKRSLGMLADCYRQQYGCNFVTAIIANLFGPGDDFDLETSHAIPAIIRRMVEARESNADEVVLWGDGSPSRDFFYVGDAVAGLIAVGDNYNRPGPINLGTGAEHSIEVVAGLIKSAVRYGGRIEWNGKRPNGQQRRCLDVSAQTALGFAPKMTLVDGIAKTVAWYLENR